MTRAEWSEIAEILVANWPHCELPDVSLEKWFGDLEDLPAAHVHAAIEVLYRDGREFMPNGAHIRAKVVELSLDLPEWPAVMRRLVGLLGHHPRTYVGASDEGDSVFRDDRAIALARESPALQSFCEQLGWDQIRAGLSGEGGDEARLRSKWEAFARRAERRLAYTGLETGGLPGLQIPVEAEPRRIADVVAAALPERAAA